MRSAALFLPGRRSGTGLLGGLALVPLFGLAAASERFGDPEAALPLLRARQIEQASHMVLSDRAEILVEGSDAQARNAALPFSDEPIEAVRKFHLRERGNPDYAAALTCLTQAVYYEAAAEPLVGRGAVAQVVLNRVRHPLYPKSVCGVVYQGWERETGCQFSFVCDGSLLRRPVPYLWREAEAVARKALNGATEPSVGAATHYHADYVLPKWAFKLAKIAQSGTHIFYRFDGRLGRARALAGRYRGAEIFPTIDLETRELRLPEEEEPVLAVAEAPPAAQLPEPVFDFTDRQAPGGVKGTLVVAQSWRLPLPEDVAAGRQQLNAPAAPPPPAPADAPPVARAFDEAPPGR